MSSYVPDSNFNFETSLKEPTEKNFLFENATPEIILETVSKPKLKTSSGKDIFSTTLIIEINVYLEDRCSFFFT